MPSIYAMLPQDKKVNNMNNQNMEDIRASLMLIWGIFTKGPRIFLVDCHGLVDRRDDRFTRLRIAGNQLHVSRVRIISKLTQFRLIVWNGITEQHLRKCSTSNWEIATHSTTRTRRMQAATALGSPDKIGVIG